MDELEEHKIETWRGLYIFNLKFGWIFFLFLHNLLAFTLCGPVYKGHSNIYMYVSKEKKGSFV